MLEFYQKPKMLPGAKIQSDWSVLMLKRMKLT